MCLSGGKGPGPGGVPGPGVPAPRGCLVPGGCLVETPPRRDGYCCGRYASYWNAFLFLFLISLLFLLTNQMKIYISVSPNEWSLTILRKILATIFYNILLISWGLIFRLFIYLVLLYVRNFATCHHIHFTVLA